MSDLKLFRRSERLHRLAWNRAGGSTRRPFVLLNMAMSADGKIATANRRISSFTSARDHDRLLELRATADAVMVGARTADLNKVDLGPGSLEFRQARRRRGLEEYNLRIVVSRLGTVSPKAHLFKLRFSPIVILTTESAPKSRLERLRKCGAEVAVFGKTEIDFPRAFAWLRKKWRVRRLLCEGGGELNAMLFKQGLIDEAHLTISPKILGGRHAPTICDGASVEHLSECTGLKLKSVTLHGDELFTTWRAR